MVDKTYTCNDTKLILDATKKARRKVRFSAILATAQVAFFGFQPARAATRPPRHGTAVAYACAPSSPAMQLAMAKRSTSERFTVPTTRPSSTTGSFL